MPRALVLSPWITDFKLYDEWMHPLGLYFLIGLLRHNGYQVIYHSCLKRLRAKRWNTADFVQTVIPKPTPYRTIARYYKRYGETPEEFNEFLRSIPAPDLVCIGSGMTYWIIGLEQTVEAVRAVFPFIPMVIGGTSAQLMQEVFAARLPATSVYAGRLFDRAARVSSGIPLFAELTSHDWTPSLIPALEAIPLLCHGPALTSMGCPFACSYCASQLLHGPYQARPLELVAAEIEYLVARGVADIAFYDDALLYHAEENFLPLMDWLLIRDIKARLHAPNGLHIREITPQIARILRRANFMTLRFGYESGDPRLRDHTAQKAGREMLREKTAMLIDAGFSGRSIGIYVMAGIEGQRPEQVHDEIAFVLSLGVTPKPVFLSPVPHTPLFDIYARRFPQIKNDPLTHNDAYFVSQIEGWSIAAMERVVIEARGKKEIR